MIGNKYYLHSFEEKFNSLEEILPQLQTSNLITKHQYFDNEEMKVLELRTKFLGLNIEENILQGESKFEIAETFTDMDDKFYINPKACSVNFFIGIIPFQHIIVITVSSGLATTISRRINRILFNKNSSTIPRFKLNDSQIIKFLNENRYVMKSGFWGTNLEGVSTLGMYGSNIEKPVEVELLRKYLTEHKSLQVLLLDKGWTIWISKNTGGLSCIDSHDSMEFIEFIQEKIFSL